MPSKQVTDRQKSGSSVVAAGEAHADRVATELDAVLSPYLRKGEKIPNLALFMHLVTRALADARDAMVAADEAHQAELADDAAPREARDEAATALYAEITDLREWLTGLYGAAATKRLGFSDITPRDPVALERFAGEITGALGSQPLPKPRRKGVRWAPAETIQQIDALRASLRQHLKDVAREAREAEATVIAKSAAMAAYDERFSRVATCLAGVFRLAGPVDLAARVRPSARRPGQTEADASSDAGSDATDAAAGAGGAGG
jgi:hypothetical protein